MKTLLTVSLILAVLCLLKVFFPRRKRVKNHVVIAYATSWSKAIPDAACVTHINYAFGHVNKTFDGVHIDLPENLRAIVSLKRRSPQLKVLLAIGGWTSGGFSEMAADSVLRSAFAQDCRRTAESMGLDGFDIDWEYPGIPAAGISASPADTANYTLLMRDLRAALGPAKLLTIASDCRASHIDYRAVLPYIDFVDIMSYDMAPFPKHHAALFPSDSAGTMTVDEAVKAHLDAGVPAEKLVLGMSFYGHGDKAAGRYSIDYNTAIRLRGCQRRWDDKAKVPYLVNEDGKVVCCYDDAESLSLKCAYIRSRGLLGGMYWDCAGDDLQGTLSHAVFNALK